MHAMMIPTDTSGGMCTQDSGMIIFKPANASTADSPKCR
jgi:hypothetical protein